MLKSMIKVSLIGFLGIVVLIGSACNRLNSVPGNISALSEEVTLVFDISTSSNYVEAGNPVTLNVQIYQRRASDPQLTPLTESDIDAADIVWGTTSESPLISAKGYQVVLTAPSASGNLTVYAGLNTPAKYTDLGIFDLPGQVTINVVSILKPSAPRGLSAKASDNTVALTWNPNSEKYLGGYYLYYAVDTGQTSTPEWTHRVTVNASATAVTVSELSNDSHYIFALYAYSNSRIIRLSEPSVAVQAVPSDSVAPLPPTDFSAVQTAPSQNAISLHWSNPTAPDFRGVLVVRRTSPGTPISPADPTGVVVYNGPGTSAIDAIGIKPGITYYYSIYAYDDEKSPNFSSVYGPLVIVPGI